MTRIRVLGASGSGTSTLGTELARRLRVPHTDADNLYWLSTDPPFTTPRPLQDRQRLLLQSLPSEGQWVFSGAATQWSALLDPHYTLVVFLYLDPAIRMVRLRQREAQRFGARIHPTGDMAAIHAAFMAWAESYDTDGASQHGFLAHMAWLADQSAPILRLNSEAPVAQLAAAVQENLASFL